MEVPQEVTGKDVVASYFQIGKSDAMQQIPVRGSGWMAWLFQVHEKQMLVLRPLSQPTTVGHVPLLVLLPGGGDLEFLQVPPVTISRTTD